MELKAINSKAESKVADIAQEAPKSEMRAMTVEEIQGVIGGAIPAKSPARIRQILAM